MIVYDVQLSRAEAAVTSRLQLQQLSPYHYQSNGLMLTSSLKLLVCVERGRIIIWRLSSIAQSKMQSKYLADDAPADDQDCDVESYHYDDTSDDLQKVMTC